jgi:FHA domain-containing protein
MDRMNLTIDIRASSVGPKRVNLRSSLLVDNLIATIKDKFNLDGEFELRVDNARQALQPGVELDRAGVTDGAVLVVTRIVESTGTIDAIRRGQRARLSKNFKRVYLQEGHALAEYDLAWQPAVIGRKDNRDPSKNKLLAVDLGDMEEASSVSRHHACITEEGGSFYLESINEHNPTYLGDMRLRFGVKYPLPVGSRIGIGHVSLTFYTVG